MIDFIQANLGLGSIILMMAMLSGIIVSVIIGRRNGIAAKTILIYTILALPLAILSGFLYSMITNWSAFVSAPLDTLLNGYGETAIYGALIGLMITAAVISKIKHISLPILLDVLAPGMALATAIGRFSDYFTGSAFGLTVKTEALKLFPVSVYASSLSSWLYAIFIYEAVFCFLIFILLVIGKKRIKKPGDTFLWLLLLYSSGRIVFESMRADSAYLGFVKISQVLALLTLLAILIVFAKRAIANRRLKKSDLAFWFATLVCVGIAFLAEYYMGEATYFRNTFGLAISVAIMLLISLKFYQTNSRKLQE